MLNNGLAGDGVSIRRFHEDSYLAVHQKNLVVCVCSSLGVMLRECDSGKHLVVTLTQCYSLTV